jgi:hypothetical protein
VNYIRQETALCQQSSAALCLCFTCGRKSDIDPTGEEILSIPFGFAVAQEDEIHSHILKEKTEIFKLNA